jgi:hypothetical protein
MDQQLVMSCYIRTGRTTICVTGYKWKSWGVLPGGGSLEEPQHCTVRSSGTKIGNTVLPKISAEGV